MVLCLQLNCRDERRRMTYIKTAWISSSRVRRRQVGGPVSGYSKTTTLAVVEVCSKKVKICHCYTTYDRNLARAYFRVLLYHYNYVFRHGRGGRVLCELEWWWVVHLVIIGVMQIKQIINPYNFYPSKTRQTLFTIANFIPHLAWISNDMCCV